jgi:hypothetical protein
MPKSSLLTGTSGRYEEKRRENGETNERDNGRKQETN